MQQEPHRLHSPALLLSTGRIRLVAALLIFPDNRFMGYLLFSPNHINIVI